MQRSISLKISPSPASKCFDLCDTFAQSGRTPPFPIRAIRLLNSHNITPLFPPDILLPPPWILNRPKICTSLSYLLKRNITSPEVFRQHALEHIRRKGNQCILYTDGSKSDHCVGAAAISSSSLNQVSIHPTASVFTAELIAICLALDMILSNNLSSVIICCDSRSALDGINQFAPKNKLIQEIQFKIHNLVASGCSIQFCWIPAHVGICGNEKADKAAKEAASLEISCKNLPVSDWITSIRKIIFKDWQVLWEALPQTNKLREIKNHIDYWPSSSQKSRELEVILTRLRIGHTRFTHGHLMETPHAPVPRCSSCNVMMSVKHLLIECPIFNQIRNIHFKNSNISKILAEGSDFSINRIISFLKLTKFYDKI